MPNRRATLERLKGHISLTNRSGHNLSLLGIDLDHFKQVNDSWGHSAGDVVLRAFARIVSAMGRETDFCGRMGGEEFVFVFPNTDADAALEIGNRLRALLADNLVDLGNGESVNLSLSAGLATLRPDESMEALLCRADEAMYRAKRQGRDQICE